MASMQKKRNSDQREEDVVVAMGKSLADEQEQEQDRTKVGVPT